MVLSLDKYDAVLYAHLSILRLRASLEYAPTFASDKLGVSYMENGAKPSALASNSLDGGIGSGGKESLLIIGVEPPKRVLRRKSKSLVKLLTGIWGKRELRLGQLDGREGAEKAGGAVDMRLETISEVNGLEKGGLCTAAFPRSRRGLSEAGLWSKGAGVKDGKVSSRENSFAKKNKKIKKRGKGEKGEFG